MPPFRDDKYFQFDNQFPQLWFHSPHRPQDMMIYCRAVHALHNIAAIQHRTEMGRNVSGYESTTSLYTKIADLGHMLTLSRDVQRVWKPFSLQTVSFVNKPTVVSLSYYTKHQCQLSRHN